MVSSGHWILDLHLSCLIPSINCSYNKSRRIRSDWKSVLAYGKFSFCLRLFWGFFFFFFFGEQGLSESSVISSSCGPLNWAALQDNGNWVLWICHIGRICSPIPCSLSSLPYVLCVLAFLGANIFFRISFTGSVGVIPKICKWN